MFAVLFANAFPLFTEVLGSASDFIEIFLMKISYFKTNALWMKRRDRSEKSDSGEASARYHYIHVLVSTEQSGSGSQCIKSVWRARGI